MQLPIIRFDDIAEPHIILFVNQFQTNTTGYENLSIRQKPQLLYRSCGDMSPIPFFPPAYATI